VAEDDKAFAPQRRKVLIKTEDKSEDNSPPAAASADENAAHSRVTVVSPVTRTETADTPKPPVPTPASQSTISDISPQPKAEPADAKPETPPSSEAPEPNPVEKNEALAAQTTASKEQSLPEKAVVEQLQAKYRIPSSKVSHGLSGAGKAAVTVLILVLLGLAATFFLAPDLIDDLRSSLTDLI
jgi:hypothetical protein